jgi:hypothetical protein
MTRTIIVIAAGLAFTATLFAVPAQAQSIRTFVTNPRKADSVPSGP